MLVFSNNITFSTMKEKMMGLFIERKILVFKTYVNKNAKCQQCLLVDIQEKQSKNDNIFIFFPLCIKADYC